MAGPLEYPIRMDGDFPKDSLVLIGARIDEGINRITKIDIEFYNSDSTLDLDKLVGSDLRLTVTMPGALERVIPGVCVAAQYLGLTTGQEHFHAELRPWYWLLSRTADSRVYQEISVPDLIQQVLGEYGFSDIDKRLTGSYAPREYLLQYRETDIDFLTRVAEEEGIFFFFVEKNGKDVMVLADNTGAYDAIPGEVEVPFRPRDDNDRFQLEHLHSWAGGRAAGTGRYTLNDYNFEKPKADLKVASAQPKGKHEYKDYEVYDYPGKFRETSEGERYAKFRMEAEAIDHHRVHGAGTVPRLKVGHKFKLTDHPRKVENAEYMVTRMTHLLRLDDYHGGFLGGIDLDGIEDKTSSLVSLEAVPADEQYRAREATPKPLISGLQTAVVVGPKGEEIHTDKYGRVKIQFHWDREGKKDETSSCWVRTMMPWTGKNWGMIHIPRIGQEVVVNFEEGDPDRPIVVGMLYNADTMPPYALDANKTQSGIKTNSSLDGGGFNELMFEDKKDSELVRFQAERDFEQIVKNDAKITVGKEHSDKGDMSLEVHRNLTEKVLTGDHTFRVEQGNQTCFIKTDQTETVEGKRDFTLTGNLTEVIKQGDMSTTLDLGNITQTVKMGNIERKASLGKITEEAMQSIEFKVGANSIKIDQSGVTIKGLMVKIDAQIMLDAKGMITQVSGQTMTTVKGGVVMIN